MVKLIHGDLGQRRAGEIVEIISTSGANVRLMDSSNFTNYKNGRRHRYTGGLVKISPVELQISNSGHLYDAFDMEGPRGNTRAAVRMLPGTVPEICNEPVSLLPGPDRDNVPPAPYAGSKDAEALGMLGHHVDVDRSGYRLNVHSPDRARGRSDTPLGPQRATGGMKRAARRPRLGHPEEYKRSTRSPGGGAPRRSAGMRPDSFYSPKDGLEKQLCQYFLKGFYDDHVKCYKKRPIYWLIFSPKGTLQALIYLHRYNRDTINRFLNDYLRPYQQKLEAKLVGAEDVLTAGASSQSEKAKAQKRIDEMRKALQELSTWEPDVVRPLAEKRIELDLDDGVKVNYGKLGAILAKVKGLNG